MRRVPAAWEGRVKVGTAEPGRNVLKSQRSAATLLVGSGCGFGCGWHPGPDANDTLGDHVGLGWAQLRMSQPAAAQRRLPRRQRALLATVISRCCWGPRNWVWCRHWHSNARMPGNLPRREWPCLPPRGPRGMKRSRRYGSGLTVPECGCHRSPHRERRPVAAFS